VQDIAFVAAMVLLTAVVALFIAACNMLMGPGEQVLAESDRGDADAARTDRRPDITGDDVTSIIIAVLFGGLFDLLVTR